MPDEIIDTADVAEQLTVPFAEFAVTRQARLFEAGEYPDKDITVTEDDLEAIASRGGEIPLKVEHGDTVFDGVLGTCGNLVRKGKELWGSLSFTDAAWNLLQTTKHRGLSCGILRDKSGIAEVSLVREPRIASAQVFSEGVVGFTSDVPWTYATDGAMTKSEEVITMPETKTDEMTVQEALRIVRELGPNNAEAKAVFDAHSQTLEYVQGIENELKETAVKAREVTMELQKANTERLIEGFKRTGKITPAAEPFARAILQQKPLSAASAREEHTVTFSTDDGDARIHFADAFVRFLEALSPVISFQEIARQSGSEADLPPSAAEIFRQLGVDPTSETSRKVIAEMRR